MYIDWIEGVPWEATQSATRITQKEYALLESKNVLESVVIGDTVQSNLIDIIYDQNNLPQMYVIKTSKL